MLLSEQQDIKSEAAKSLQGGNKPIVRYKECYYSPLYSDNLLSDEYQKYWTATNSVSTINKIQNITNDTVSRYQRLYNYIAKAKNMNEISIATANNALDAWKKTQNELPITVPDASYGPDGQILLFWSKSAHYLEMEIESNGNIYYFYKNRVTGDLWDSEGLENENLHDELLEKLRLFI